MAAPLGNRKTPDKVSVTTNRRARFEYEVLEVFEAGLVLTGTEVKSLRDGKCSLGDGYVQVRRGEAYLYNVHIPEYSHGNRENHEPRRVRKLLLHLNEIARIEQGTERSGQTCIPLELYFLHGRAKIEIALARGKKDIDKRDDQKAREDRREMRKYVGRG